MSIELVGKELLPNVYIKNIEISDLSNTMLGASIKVCVIDSKNNTDGFFWSDKDLILKNMKLLFVTSQDESMIAGITNSSIRFSANHIKKHESYSPKTTSLQIKNVSIAKKYTRQELDYYEHEFKISFFKASQSVVVFCAASIDTRNLAQQYGLDLYNEKIELFTGPISSEKIFTNSEISRQTTLFLNSQNQQYIGPVHYHPKKGYMAGARHMDMPHPILQRKNIYNYKIKDYREHLYVQKNTSVSFAKLKTKTEFTKLYNSFTSGNQTVAAMFGINIFNIIMNRTLYGQSLYRLDQELAEQIYSNFIFKNIIVERQKIKPSSSKTELIDQINIIKSYDGLGDSGPVGDLSRVYLDLNVGKNNLRFYEFMDRNLNSTSGGFYRYKIKFAFNDPSEKIVHSMINELDTALSQVKSYFITMSTKNNFDQDLNKTTDLFINFNDLTYASNPRTAPFMSVPAVFLKYKKYLYNISDKQDRILRANLFSWLHPRHATIKSVREFIRQFQFLIHEVKDYFNFNVNAIKDMETKSHLKNNTTTQMIQMEHTFEQIIQPSAAKVHYNFLPTVAGGPLGKVTLEQIRSRLSSESEKFGVSISSAENPNIFLSPSQVAEGQTSIALTNIPFDNIQRVESMLNNARVETEFNMDWNSTIPSVDDAPLMTRQLNQIMTTPTRPIISQVENQTTVNSTVRPGAMSSFANFNKHPLAAVAKSHTTPRDTIPALSMDVFKAPINIISSNIAEALTISEPICEDNANNTTTAEAAAAASGMSLATFIETTRKTSATAYFSDESKFANFEVERESCFKIKKSDSFKKAVSRKIASSVILPTRNNDNFNLASKMSYVGDLAAQNSSQPMINPAANNANVGASTMQAYDNFIGQRTSLPLQIRRLFDPNMRISDIVKIKGQVITEMEYFSLVKIEVLEGFHVEDNTDTINLKNNNWKNLTNDHLQNLNRPLFCKMSYYTNQDMDIEADSVTKLPFSNKYFFISSTNVNAPPTGVKTESNIILAQEVNKYLNYKQFSMDHSTSNIIIQDKNINIVALQDKTGGDVIEPMAQPVAAQRTIISSDTGLDSSPAGIFSGGGDGSGGDSMGGYSGGGSSMGGGGSSGGGGY